MADDRVFVPWIDDPDAPADHVPMSAREAADAATKAAELFPDLIEETFAPHSSDPDAPADSVPMTRDEARAAAAMAAIMFPDLIRFEGQSGISRPQVMMAFQKVIMILDASEPKVRDLIERRLANKAGYGSKIKDAVGIAKRVTEAAAKIRRAAFKKAFRYLRSQIGYVEIKGKSLAAWAAHLANLEAARIDAIIRSGMLAGQDNTEIAASVIGTMMLRGSDGITEHTRQHIGLLARVHVANVP